jgi:hypothetical protein
MGSVATSAPIAGPARSTTSDAVTTITALDAILARSESQNGVTRAA